MTSTAIQQQQESVVTAPSHHIPGKADAWTGARFQNPPNWTTWETRTLSEVLKWQKERKALGHSLDGWLEGITHPTKEEFARAFPLNPVDWQAVAHPVADAIQAVWVGHATVLVQQAGLTYITDPCFSYRCSPVQWAGPKRVVDAAFTPDSIPADAPKLDFVLLSHNHFDHLDANSVKMLHKRYGDALTWYVPLGLKSWFTSRGMRDNVIELDWWEEVQHKDSQARITFVPAQHWSQRGPLDRFYSLWGGYVVKTKQPELSFYFAGDTGYCEVFKEIGERLGPMDLSAIPTGAYEPRWFLKPQHVDTEEALQVHLDVKSRRSLAIHCCTWSLTDEPMDEPPKRLAQGLEARGMDPQEFVTLQHGEMLVARDGKTLNAPKVLPHAA